MNCININGRNIDLYFNVMAMRKISDRCGGDLEGLSDKIDSLNACDGIELLCGMLCDLANGAVAKHNSDIDFKLADGEKQEFYTEDFFKVNISIADMNNLFGDVFETMGMGSQFEVPDELKTEEKDIDLAEIEAENESKKS